MTFTRPAAAVLFAVLAIVFGFFAILELALLGITALTWVALAVISVAIAVLL